MKWTLATRVHCDSCIWTRLKGKLYEIGKKSAMTYGLEYWLIRKQQIQTCVAVWKTSNPTLPHDYIQEGPMKTQGWFLVKYYPHENLSWVCFFFFFDSLSWISSDTATKYQCDVGYGTDTWTYTTSAVKVLFGDLQFSVLNHKKDFSTSSYLQFLLLFHLIV